MVLFSGLFSIEKPSLFRPGSHATPLELRGPSLVPKPTQIRGHGDLGGNSLFRNDERRANHRSQTLRGDPPILMKAPLRIHGKLQNAFGGHPSGQATHDTCFLFLGEGLRLRHIPVQGDPRARLVDVLSARTAGTTRSKPNLPERNRDVTGDGDELFHNLAHVPQGAKGRPVGTVTFRNSRRNRLPCLLSPGTRRCPPGGMRCSRRCSHRLPKGFQKSRRHRFARQLPNPFRSSS